MVVHIAKGAQQVATASQRADWRAAGCWAAACRTCWTHSRDCRGSLSKRTSRLALLRRNCGGRRLLQHIHTVGAAQEARTAAAAGVLQGAALLTTLEQQAGAVVPPHRLARRRQLHRGSTARALVEHTGMLPEHGVLTMRRCILAALNLDITSAGSNACIAASTSPDPCIPSPAHSRLAASSSRSQRPEWVPWATAAACQTASPPGWGRCSETGQEVEGSHAPRVAEERWEERTARQTSVQTPCGNQRHPRMSCTPTSQPAPEQRGV